MTEHVTSSSNTTTPVLASGSGTTSSNPHRLTLCLECTLKPSIYTCPACSIRTCSLACSNQHKLRVPCAGKRNRVEAIPMNKYSWGSLMQDYTYLEDVNRVLVDARRSEKSCSSGLNLSNLEDPKILNRRDRLVKKAASEGVRLVLMAEGMSRRKMNTTNYKHP
ncbi:hypothetical protein CROQUDRAFT_653156 [Cronartium quercuum f. sp. fusiforme G11]|uniref:HIT-type domain-containing protein n=1 Tax=Cronartium quercuum f. sp. fusiforme G11 TaxID=708437 RepID=A0A9P6TFL2_9BASI|nr:hypothetical protein CROQUDRAFT_653156 [Cronartium quercuum f. sp. fusiforme G11]